MNNIDLQRLIINESQELEDFDLIYEIPSAEAELFDTVDSAELFI